MQNTREGIYDWILKELSRRKTFDKMLVIKLNQSQPINLPAPNKMIIYSQVEEKVGMSVLLAKELK